VRALGGLVRCSRAPEGVHGMRCLALWISAMSWLAGMVMIAKERTFVPSSRLEPSQGPAKANSGCDRSW
jgi:hypothetical protein